MALIFRSIIVFDDQSESLKGPTDSLKKSQIGKWRESRITFANIFLLFSSWDDELLSRQILFRTTQLRVGELRQIHMGTVRIILIAAEVWRRRSTRRRITGSTTSSWKSSAWLPSSTRFRISPLEALSWSRLSWWPLASRWVRHFENKKSNWFKIELN